MDRLVVLPPHFHDTPTDIEETTRMIGSTTAFSKATGHSDAIASSLSSKRESLCQRT